MNTDRWEAHLRETAAQFSYPPTPDLAGAVQRRLAAGRERPRPARSPARLAWAALAVLLVLGLLLAVPQVRAAIFEFFQIGDIRIFPAEPTSTPAATPRRPAVMTSRPAATSRPSPTPRLSIDTLVGESTLAGAEARLDISIPLPTLPAGLGPPDRVFVQELDGPVVILVWLEPGSQPLILYLLRLTEGAFGGKFETETTKTTTVNGQIAYWVEGEHILRFYDAQGREIFEPARLVEGNVLIWVEDDITYRLETALTEEEAIQIAESLQ
ncbi:MAG: DUF4367 domain-containing protein [Chloroflexi bacterium]|nr:DUF4367 domain-containing protein [Chloroflexota bacterium]MCI0575232.1 DUF4367 domain-containing protein [Chloroflexota bacterium]MCI0648847.1 DUF4367 domain-containing protein [Chloroflexota bacterium]MCI0726602.1 DUF4367 domain-containing protein [Chloroflexota bacterium]